MCITDTGLLQAMNADADDAMEWASETMSSNANSMRFSVQLCVGFKRDWVWKAGSKTCVWLETQHAGDVWLLRKNLLQFKHSVERLLNSYTGKLYFYNTSIMIQILVSIWTALQRLMLRLGINKERMFLVMHFLISYWLYFYAMYSLFQHIPELTH